MSVSPKGALCRSFQDFHTRNLGHTSKALGYSEDLKGTAGEPMPKFSKCPDFPFFVIPQALD